MSLHQPRNLAHQENNSSSSAWRLLENVGIGFGIENGLELMTRKVPHNVQKLEKNSAINFAQILKVLVMHFSKICSRLYTYTMQALFLQLCDSESEPSILVCCSTARMQSDHTTSLFKIALFYQSFFHSASSEDGTRSSSRGRHLSRMNRRRSSPPIRSPTSHCCSCLWSRCRCWWWAGTNAHSFATSQQNDHHRGPRILAYEVHQDCQMFWKKEQHAIIHFSLSNSLHCFLLHLLVKIKKLFNAGIINLII